MKKIQQTAFQFHSEGRDLSRHNEDGWKITHPQIVSAPVAASHSMPWLFRHSRLFCDFQHNKTPPEILPSPLPGGRVVVVVDRRKLRILTYIRTDEIDFPHIANNNTVFSLIYPSIHAHDVCAIIQRNYSVTTRTPKSPFSQQKSDLGANGKNE